MIAARHVGRERASSRDAAPSCRRRPRTPRPGGDVGVRERGRPVPRITERRRYHTRSRCPRAGWSDGPGRSRSALGQPVAEDHVARVVVAVADQLGPRGDRRPALASSSHTARAAAPTRPTPRAAYGSAGPGRRARRRPPSPAAAGCAACHRGRTTASRAPLVDAERKRRGGEPGVAQVGQVRLHGQVERPQRPPHRVPDPHDPLGDAIAGQRLPSLIPQHPSQRPAYQLTTDRISQEAVSPCRCAGSRPRRDARPRCSRAGRRWPGSRS